MKLGELLEKIRNRCLVVYYRQKGVVIGRGTSLKRFKASQYHGIEIGKNVRINEGVTLLCRKGCKLIIGDDSTISQGVTILTSGYDVERFMLEDERTHLNGLETVIGCNSWICTNATIVGGVRIRAHHVIVAAGAVVTSDITENYSLYAGVPALLKKRYNNKSVSV